MTLVTNLIILGGATVAFLAAGGPERVSGFISQQTSQIRSSSFSSDTPREIRDVAESQGPRQNTPSREQEQTPNVTINLTGTAQDIATLPREQRRTNQRKIEQTIPQEIRANTSISNSRRTRGSQIKRPTGFSFEEFDRGRVTNTSSRFEQTLKKEQQRAEETFARLFGNVQKDSFATGGKS